MKSHVLLSPPTLRRGLLTARVSQSSRQAMSPHRNSILLLLTARTAAI